MNRIRGFRVSRAGEEISKCGSLYSGMMKLESFLVDVVKVRSFHCRGQGDGGGVAGVSNGDLDVGKLSVAIKNLKQRFVVSSSHEGKGGNFFRGYSSRSGKDPNISRDFLVQLWVDDRKKRKIKQKRKQIRESSVNVNDEETVYDNPASLQQVFGKLFSKAFVTDEKTSEPEKPILKQPPPSQRMTGPLKPATSLEAQVAPLLARSTLLITRDIEWANLMLGFEQENRYGIVDVSYPGTPVGLIREQSNIIARQLLRTRRPFVAHITDASGNELFRVRRPFWWINSSIYAEINGKEVGVVHRRWHLWRRIYDLYLGNEQFAVVENPGFWNWTFTLKDINGEVLAQIDRDWRGFGFEILTDAGQYVIRFGTSDIVLKSGPASLTEELQVVRPLTLSERAVAVALAVSLDNDYFSRHGGWGLPFIGIDE
ncbi:hypothetical protein ACET3Z_009131 [Daucus carota]